MHCFLVLLPLFFVGEGEPNLNRIKARIFTLDSELLRMESALERVNQDSSKVSDEIGKLELERALLNGRILRHELELDQADERIAAAERDEVLLQEHVDSQRERIGLRLRELYKRGNLGYAELFLRQTRLDQLIGAYNYAKVLTERDNKLLMQFQASARELKAKRDELVQLREQADATRAELLTKRGELDELLSRREKSLADIRNQASRQEKMMNDLALEREELNLLTRKLVDENIDPFEAQLSIQRYKGRLDWPAEGPLKRKFGIYKDPEFRTERPQNGILIGVPIGKPIHAVYAGRVVYADWFKSYGNLVIIDHRDKVVSFYAHNSQLLVKKGDYVERNQIVSLSGDSGSLEGPLLHFEIRNKTKPENPLDWLQTTKKAKKKRRR